MAASMNSVEVALGLIYRDQTVLFAERPPDKSYSGYWELPGGKVEANETSYAALVRELNEEVGITVTSASLLHQYNYTYPERIVNLYVWRVQAYEGDAYGREGQRLQWIDVTHMSTLNLLPAMLLLLPHIKNAISAPL